MTDDSSIDSRRREEGRRLAQQQAPVGDQAVRGGAGRSIRRPFAAASAPRPPAPATDPKNSFLLTSTGGVANFFVLALALIAFLKPDGLKGGLETNLAQILGFGDTAGMDRWRRSANGSFTEAARTMDMSRVDTARARQEYENYARLAPSGNPILELIGRHESGGDYNRVYGLRMKRVNLTGMTINEVLQWQDNYVRTGSPSSAAGKYQIISTTLRGLVSEMGLTGNEKFDERMQDRMAMRLMERRGYSEFMRTGDAAKFMHNLSQEWAALPKDGSGLSYYHGDGLNRAGVSPQTVQSVLAQTRTQRPEPGPA